MPSLQVAICVLASVTWCYSLPAVSSSTNTVRFHVDQIRPRRDVPPSSYAYSPPSPGGVIPVVPMFGTQQTSEDDYNGTFNYSFVTDDGTSVRLSGRPKPLATGEVVQTMEGEYSYVAPDGTPVTTRWYADETGFHAVGAHIPGSKL